jgi:hypothetical protein
LLTFVDMSTQEQKIKPPETKEFGEPPVKPETVAKYIPLSFLSLFADTHSPSHANSSCFFLNSSCLDNFWLDKQI